MHFHTLTDWLDWQATLHPQTIDLGLARCQQVAQRLQLDKFPFKIITVAGTNGKGSSVALLETIYRVSGYKTGSYTSPHLLRYNERICIAGQPVTDAQLCEAFTAIEHARNAISLTYFEFGTLAALWLFQRHVPEVVILEVGLGGRLDAVNGFDADVALITQIGIDHVEWLGPDRETIGLEKAGILRAQRPAVCSDPQPPQSVLNYAKTLSAELYCLNHHFSYQKVNDNQWHWYSESLNYPQLPLPNLQGEYQLQNAAGVLQVISLLATQLPVTEAAISHALQTLQLQGRFQIFPGTVTRILDVAHNPLGVRMLSDNLQQHQCVGKTHAVVGILQDKDAMQMLANIAPQITQWYVAPLDTPRSTPAAALSTQLQQLGQTEITQCESVQWAYQQAQQQAQPGDRIVVFGSFYTVAAALAVECGHESA
jgi:dihydrofolate synthase/folylpolyglutamate synthase